jgi:hypothetical protein
MNGIDNLSAAEPLLFHAVAHGVDIDFRQISTDKSMVNIRAELVRDICLGQHAQAPLTVKGVYIKGAVINGRLDFQDARIAVPLRFDDCVFTDVVDLQHANIKRLKLWNCELQRGIKADRLSVDGDVIINKCRSFAPIDFPSANIRSRMILDGTTIEIKRSNDHNDPLSDTTRARNITDIYDSGFNRSLISVDNGIFFAQGFSCDGVVDLHNSNIRGNVEFLGVSIKSNAKDQGWIAIDLSNSVIEGYLFIRQSSRIEGVIDLFSAQMKLGEIRESVIGPRQDQVNSKVSLDAERMVVHRNFVIGRNSTVMGGANLLGAQIGGELIIQSQESGSRKSESLLSIQGELNLMHSVIGNLKVDFAAWLRSADLGKLFPKINGCRYAEISKDEEPLFVDTAELIKWLKTAKDGSDVKGGYNSRHNIPNIIMNPLMSWFDISPFHPQPFEHLASLLRSNGRNDDAKEIAVAKLQLAIWAPSKSKNGSGKVVSILLAMLKFFFYWIFGFGYRTKRMVGFSCLIIVICSFIYQYAYIEDKMGVSRELVYLNSRHEIAVTMAPEKTESAEKNGQSRIWRLLKVLSFQDYKIIGEQTNSLRAWPPDEYTSFNAIVFSLDVFLPIVNLHQEEAWLPKSGGAGSLAWLAIWIEIIAGWVLSTLIVASLTGLIKND